MPSQQAAADFSNATTPHKTRRLRSYRWPAGDVPWISKVSLPSPDHARWKPLDARLLDMSNSGLHLSSGTQFVPGQTAVIRLSGPGTDLVLGVRIVRSRTDTHSTGISYQTAAAFNEPLMKLPPVPSTRGYSRATVGRLTDLISYINLSMGRGTLAGTLQPAIEEGLERVVDAREIRIRESPAVNMDGCESVYFLVPTGAEPAPILQATFEPQYPLEMDEFELLEAAALLAADVLRIDGTARIPGASHRKGGAVFV